MTMSALSEGTPAQTQYVRSCKSFEFAHDLLTLRCPGFGFSPALLLYVPDSQTLPLRFGSGNECRYIVIASGLRKMANCVEKQHAHYWSRARRPTFCVLERYPKSIHAISGCSPRLHREDGRKSVNITGEERREETRGARNKAKQKMVGIGGGDSIYRTYC